LKAGIGPKNSCLESHWYLAEIRRSIKARRVRDVDELIPQSREEV
jgi:hypothetical protein